MSALSERPRAPVRRTARSRTRARPCTSPAQALYTDDLVSRTTDVLHAYPVQVPHAHARVTALRTEPGARRARRGPRAHRRRRARRQRRRASSTTSRCSRARSCSTATPCAGCSARRSRPRGWARRRSRSTYEPLPSLVTRRPRRSRRRASRARTRQLRRGDVEARLRRRRRTSSAASSSSPARSTSTSRRTAALALRRRERAGLRPEQHAAPVRDAGDRRARARAGTATTSRCSACGWAAASAARRCSRTGSPRSPRSGATLTGRPVRLRLNRTQDMTMSGKRHGFHADWRVGFDDDGRLRRPRRDADRRRRLEPRPVGAGAGAGAVPHRQRVLDPQHPGERPDRADAQDVATPRSAASAGRRACW